MDMMYQDLKKQKTKNFFVFSTFLVWFSALKPVKNIFGLVFCILPKVFGLFFLVLLEFFCFSRFCLLFSMWPKLFELQVPSSGPAQRVSKYCFYNTRIYTIMVAADDRVTRG